MQRGFTTQVKGIQVTVHCELKVLNLDEGETKKLTNGRTSVPYKTNAS
jgi:hypothetical protein